MISGKKVYIMLLVILKIIFIFFLGILSLSKIVKEMNEQNDSISKSIINMVEITISVALIFFIYKI
jgi:hypothetical protein